MYKKKLKDIYFKNSFFVCL